MAQYLVSLDMPEAAGPNDPLPSIDKLVDLMRSTLLPSLESLLALKARGKVVAGGYPSGQQNLILIMEADSEEEVFETLRSLPCWKEVVDAEVARLHILEELSGR